MSELLDLNDINSQEDHTPKDDLDERIRGDYSIDDDVTGEYIWTLAIDPGPERSAYILWNRHENQIEQMDGEILNEDLLLKIIEWRALNLQIAVEGVESYGMPVGKSVFETVRWAARFEQAFYPYDVTYYRSSDCRHWLCNNRNAKKAHVNTVLKDVWGVPGTKKAPGVIYGVKNHLWSALAILTTHLKRRA